MIKLLSLLLSVLLFTACQKQITNEKEPKVPQQINGVAAKGPASKIDVCHHDVGNNTWHTINISINALPAHLAHGDIRLDDQDGDGYVLNNECGFGQMGDCDDNNAALNPATVWYKDSDNDGYGNGTSLTQCAQPAGYKLAANLTATSGDCNDNNAAVNPAATEICSNNIDDNCNGQVDENCIPSVTICNQTWMLNNLDVSKYRNGDNIPQVTDPSVWASLTTGAWCYYQNNSANGTTYGKLYNWYAVTDPRGLAPLGWHIPTLIEFTTLSNCLGGSTVSGGPLKETGTLHWNSPNTGATNSSGFTSLPSGYRTNVGTFSTPGIFALYWSSTSFDATQAYGRRVRYDMAAFNVLIYTNKGGLAVRCVKD